MTRLVTKFTTSSEALGPMRNQKSRGAAFVEPSLVAAKGSIASCRPGRSQAKVGRGGTRCCKRVVAIRTDHDLGAHAIVGEEQDEGAPKATMTRS